MKFRISSSILIGYMMLAFGWWAILLWRSNEEKLHLETELLAQKLSINYELALKTPEYTALFAKHKRYAWMVIGEGLFFVCCLILGLMIVRRSAQKEVALARQRRNFLLSITHELKSPIAAVRLVLETFSKRELTKAQTQQLTSGGLRDATRLQNLVQDLLLAARLEDSWHPHYESIHLTKMVTECIESLQFRFPLSVIHQEIAEDFPIFQADKSGINAVIMNLLENAIKYSPKGSPVVISAQNRKNGHLRISVSDQGQGIPPQEYQTVFEKFYRLGNEETRQATGTGLGLYIVKQVVTAHEGRIKIEANKPQGTVFLIDL